MLSFLPFIWICGFFFSVSFSVIKWEGFDNKELHFVIIHIVDQIQDTQEPIIIMLVIFWLEKRLKHLRRLGDELKQKSFKNASDITITTLETPHATCSDA